MTDNEWYQLLSKPQKRELQQLQWDLCEQGFGDKSDFKMKTCWDEAARRLRQKYPNPDPDKQNVDQNDSPVKKNEKKSKVKPNGDARGNKRQLVDFS